MSSVPGLRSPYETTLGIVYFARMLDKIRLHAKGELPSDYTDFIGDQSGVFDQRACRFLQISYNALTARTLQGGTEEEILQWAFTIGHRSNDEEIEIWNGFMTKRGWRDTATPRLKFRLEEANLPQDGTIQTMFDFIDADEGRALRQG
ncbi:DUF5069 domain-containing protein [Phragmitibacter flavus]|uniref:DUF5069 domain-containing protein n=1 Tax=Phragmitibacter flavus TaxID=2576071 RepID=A0A5R8KJG8_9BACT|nr:DUF5069 domain-containing protein [Phragmitibacter flavus]TLD72432.1 DUF5069 domain-containing protein [Phragmitibacter flavus]